MCNISKLCDTDTEEWHVETCQKTLKVPSFLCVIYSSCSKDSKNEINKWYFSGLSGMPYLQGFSKNWHCHKLQVFRISSCFGLLLTCQQHVDGISNQDQNHTVWWFGQRMIGNWLWFQRSRFFQPEPGGSSPGLPLTKAPMCLLLLGACGRGIAFSLKAVKEASIGHM